MARNVFNFVVLVHFIFTGRSVILIVVTKTSLCGHILQKREIFLLTCLITNLAICTTLFGDRKFSIANRCHKA
jgi:uncharacterized membrane protein